MLFPRFRSKERDLKNDIERLSAIAAAVAQAIGEAERELSGLILRLDDARSRAAFLYGDVIDGEIEGDAKSASLVAEAERFLVRGERRQEEIRAHLAVLGELAERVRASIEALKPE